MAQAMDSTTGPLGPAVHTAMVAAAGLAIAQAGPGITALGPVRRSCFLGWPGGAPPTTWPSPSMTALTPRRRLTFSTCWTRAEFRLRSSSSAPGSARAALCALPLLLDDCARRDLPVVPLAPPRTTPARA